MNRERALKIVVGVVGAVFTAMIIPGVMIVWGRDQQGYTDAMMMSLYFVLGILLLMAVRNPYEHRSLIAYAGWSSMAHATIMSVMVLRDASQRGLLPGVVIFAAVGIPLVVLRPRKRATEQSAQAAA